MIAVIPPTAMEAPNVIEGTASGSICPDISGELWPAPTRGAEAGLLKGWLVPDPSAPDEMPEVALEIPGFGIEIVVADIIMVDQGVCPAGSRMFRWIPPKALADGLLRQVRAWHLRTGKELAGSPAQLPALGSPAPASGTQGAPLQRWMRGLAGQVGAAVAQELADGLWVAAQGKALSLRFELLPIDTPCNRPRHGVRLLTDIGSGRLDLHFRSAPLMPAAGMRVPVSIECWLAAATEAAMQARAELWLTARRDMAFVPLRRIRRHRIFRRPSLLDGELLLTEEEAAEPELWLTLSVADVPGVCALPPVIGDAAPLSRARMEDSRLESSFSALAEMVRLHGQADAESHALLPLGPPPAGAALRVHAAAAATGHPFTQVIVPVYNGDIVVRDCLRALRRAATGPSEVVVVDDGSRSYTAEMLREEVAGDPLFRLHRRDINRGYTKSINEGVLVSDAPWVVILNSDTIVSHGWLDRLHAAARARPRTGMVGPLSNAATWQSIPMAKRADGSWSANDTIRPDHVERVQALLSQVSERAYPEFHVLNGFATLIAREVFDTVGLYDEDAFPIGYGEETDLCLRARRAGFRLTVADDCFVFHHKSVTFGANRQRLTRAGGFEMTNKHLGVNTAALEAAMQSQPSLVRLRARMADLLAELD